MKKAKKQRSGKSKSTALPNGKRRESTGGSEFAPKSARKRGKLFLTDCTDDDLEKAKITRRKNGK